MSTLLHPTPPAAAGMGGDGSPVDAALLVRIGRWLRGTGYAFITPTPATHARVNARTNGPAGSLADVFGWSRGFQEGLLPQEVFLQLRSAGLLEQRADLWHAAVRFSSVDERLYAHSAHPTTAADAVFFGPDTYRFISFVRTAIPYAACLIDIGCGSGAGGIELAGRADRVLLCDINDKALAFAEANAELNDVGNAICRHSDILAGIASAPDAIIANPPYLVDPARRTYRHGGGDLGIDLAVRIVRDSLSRLVPGGRLALYTGTPIIRGQDVLLASLRPLLEQRRVHFAYQEVDPDVFGEELDAPAYASADRIAAVTLLVEIPSKDAVT